jgi:hypothetical protein
MSALESPFEKWGMPKPGVTAAQIAAWFAAQPDFHDHAPDYVGSAISAQDDWAQGDSRNGAMVGIYQEVEARLRVARGGRKPRFALVPPGTISRCGLSSSHKTSAHGFDGYKGHVAIDPDVELITATAVTAGNAGDASAAPELLADHPPGGRGTLRGLAPDEHRGGRRSRDPQVGLVGSPPLDSGRQGRARARGRVGGGFALSSTLVKERSRAPLPSLAKTGAAAPEPRRATPAARDPITMA